MKKVFYYYLLTILMSATFSACGHDDEPVVQPDDDIETIELDLYSRTIKGGEVAFLNSKGSIAFNYTRGTIRLTCSYNDQDGHTHTVTTGEMGLSPQTETLYAFSDPTMKASYDGTTSSGLLNTATSVILFTFSNDDGKVVVTTHLHFAAAMTQVQNLDNGFIYTRHRKSDYLFAPIDQGHRCVLQINNFIINTTEEIEADVVQFQGLPMTPTPNGYTISTERAHSTYGGDYVITDVNIVISSQCQSISGSFKCNGHRIEMAAPF